MYVKRPHNDYQYNVKCNAELQSSLGMHPKCCAMLHSGAKMTQKYIFQKTLHEIKQSGRLCIIVAIGCSNIAVLDREVQANNSPNATKIHKKECLS